MTANGKLGIGVIGLFMGRNALFVNKDEDCASCVTAICDVDEARLMKNKDEFNVPFATTAWEEIIDRADVDIVAIFTPDHLHMPMIRSALIAGKHVICTKPMVVSLEEAIEACELVEKHRRVFLTGQTRRYVRHHMEAKALYDSGAIGDAFLAEANYIHGDMWKVFDRGSWRYTVPQKMVYGGMCHPVDHLRWYFGDVDEVFASATTRGNALDARYPTEEIFPLNIIANLRFRNGVIARAMTACGVVEQPYGSLSDVMPMEGVSVYGTKGTITNHHARYFPNGTRGEAVTVDFNLNENTLDFNGREYSGHLASVMRYIREIENCIKTGAKPAVDAVEGAKAVAVCYAIEESFMTGKPVKVWDAFSGA